MRALGPVRAFAREEHAASMVEFAIVASLLFLFFFAIIDFGRAFFLYNNLQDTARRAARYGAAIVPSPCDSIPQIQHNVRSWVQEFNNNPTDSSSYQVNVTCRYDATAAPTIPTNVKVEIANYPFNPITPLPFFNSLKITKSAGARNEGAPPGY